MRMHLLRRVAACIVMVQAACMEQWSWRITNSLSVEALPRNATELSLRTVRVAATNAGSVGASLTMAAAAELWIWPQDFVASATANVSIPCNFTLLSVQPTAFLVYTLDGDGTIVASRWQPVSNPPSRLMLPSLSVYVPPPHDMLVAYSDLRWMSMSDCVDDLSVGFTCAAAGVAFDSAGAFVPSRTTHVFYFSNNSWAAYDDGTGPITQWPYRLAQDGLFALGLRLVYDPIDDVVLAVTGFQENTASVSGLTYAAVFVLDIARWSWGGFNSSYAASSSGPPPPGSWPSTTVSRGLVILSTYAGRHELITFGGVSYNALLAGGFCYVTDLVTRITRPQDSCSWTSSVAPFFLYDSAYSLSADGSYALVVGGRSGDPSYVWTYMTVGVWRLSLIDYSWIQVTAVAIDTPDGVFPLTLVRASVFWLHDGAFVAWGGLVGNSSASSLVYDVRYVQPCARYLGGQFADDALFVSLPASVHVLTHSITCDPVIIIVPLSSLGGIIALCSVLSAAALTVLASVCCAAWRGKVRSDNRLCSLDLHAFTDAASSTAWWTLAALTLLAVQSEGSCAPAEQRATTTSLQLCLAFTMTRLMLALVTSLALLPGFCSRRQTRLCLRFGGEEADVVPAHSLPHDAWLQQASVLSYRAAAHSRSVHGRRCECHRSQQCVITSITPYVRVGAHVMHAALQPVAASMFTSRRDVSMWRPSRSDQDQPAEEVSLSVPSEAGIEIGGLAEPERSQSLPVGTSADGVAVTAISSTTRDDNGAVPPRIAAPSHSAAAGCGATRFRLCAFATAQASSMAFLTLYGISIAFAAAMLCATPSVGAVTILAVSRAAPALRMRMDVFLLLACALDAVCALLVLGRWAAMMAKAQASVIHRLHEGQTVPQQRLLGDLDDQ